MPEYSFPDDGHRHAIFGMTGTGKTVFAAWCLSRRSYQHMPWIILDFKGEELFSKLPQYDMLDVDAKIPRGPGLFIVRPTPDDVESGAATGLLYRMWERGNVGLFIDEGYMLRPRDRALQAVLTQGRSKRIPVIALSQRPAWVSPFIHSESEYKSIFYLFTPADIERVQEWLPRRTPDGMKTDPSALPPHHSLWYCTHTREFLKMNPCPPEKDILDRFDENRYRRTWI